VVRAKMSPGGTLHASGVVGGAGIEPATSAL
jgi:hypothetical protein